MHSRPALARAIDAVQTLSDPVPRYSEVLDSCRAWMGSDGATFLVFEGRQPVCFESVGIDPKAQQAYVSHFGTRDFMLDPENPRASGTWLDSECMLEAEVRLKNEYYVDFMCRYRIRQVVALVISESAGVSAALSFQREAPIHDGHGTRAPGEVRKFANAVLGAMAQRQEAGRQWFEAIESGNADFNEATLLLTSKGDVLKRSTSTDAILEVAGCGLTIRNGRLMHRESKAGSALTHLLGQALVADRVPTSLAFSGRYGKVCKLQAAKANPKLGIGIEPLVVVRLRLGWGRARPPLEAVEVGLGLSRAEALVVRALIVGQRVEQFSKEHNLSIHTVRRQLASAMTKAHCHSQAELVAKTLLLS